MRTVRRARCPGRAEVAVCRGPPRAYAANERYKAARAGLPGGRGEIKVKKKVNSVIECRKSKRRRKSKNTVVSVTLTVLLLGYRGLWGLPYDCLVP